MIPLLPYVALFTAFGLAVLLLGGYISRRAVIAYAILTVVVLAGGVQVMGYAKPSWAEINPPDEIRPAHVIYHPEIAIYVLTDDAPPRLFRMQWNTEKARKMQEGERRGGVMLKADEEGEWIPHAIPQAPNPPKDRE